MKDAERDDKICDFCGSRGILWAWETPNVVNSADEAREQNTFWVEDPWWYCCDTCHRMIIAGKQESVLDRGLLYAAPGLLLGRGEDGTFRKIDIREHVGHIHAAFWENKNDVFEEVTK